MTTADDLTGRIKVLSELLWEGRCTTPDLDLFLGNFTGRHAGSADVERLHALHLLAHVSYFGLRELRVLLKALYRDLFRYPIIQRIRHDLGGTRDVEQIHRLYEQELQGTRFVGIGGPAESGAHLLYYLRQETDLARSLFVSPLELLTGGATDQATRLTPPNLKRIVFVDDMCGSGEQAVRYGKTLVHDLRQVALRDGRSLEVQYLVLFGTAWALQRIEHEAHFDAVRAVGRLDETYRTFEAESRVFRKHLPGIDRSTSRLIAEGYGRELYPAWPLGFDNCQFLMAFHHNVPDNSLPILWWPHDATPAWTPIFRRYPKVG